MRPAASWDHFLIIVFSEITPKLIGATNPEAHRAAAGSAYVLTPLSAPFGIRLSGS